MSDDLIRRADAIEVADAVWSVTGDKNVAKVWDQLQDLPSAQPEDWMERNKERILQAGMEGREIEFRIGGRLFAIREKAQ